MTTNQTDMRAALERIAYGICGACGRTNDPKTSCTLSDDDAAAGCDGRRCFWAAADPRATALAALTAQPRPDRAGGVNGTGAREEFIRRRDKDREISSSFLQTDARGHYHAGRADAFNEAISFVQPASPAHGPDKAAEREGVEDALLLKFLRIARVNILALVHDAEDPNFGEACPNPADAECLSLALQAVIDATDLAPKPTGAEAGRGVGAEDEDALCLRSARMFIGWPTAFKARLDKADTNEKLIACSEELAGFLKRHREMALAATPTPPTPDSTAQDPFPVGTPVEKQGGEYLFPGTVVASFLKIAGQRRYVVEDDRRSLRIFSAANLRERDATPTSDSTAQGDGTSQEGGR